MNEGCSSSVAVTLSVAPAVEERLIDWMLARDEVTAFTSYTTHAHGSLSHELSAAEQVSGRQRRVELRVELPAARVDEWLGALAADFGGADVEYLVSPILRSGRLRTPT